MALPKGTQNRMRRNNVEKRSGLIERARRLPRRRWITQFGYGWMTKISPTPVPAVRFEVGIVAPVIVNDKCRLMS